MLSILKKSLFIVLSIFCLGISNCSNIKYKDDKGFLVSAQANSPEFIVYVDGKVCKDIDGIIGLCSKRVRNDTNIKFKLDKQDYNYSFKLTCSRTIDSDISTHISKNSDYEFELDHNKFGASLSFICIGEVYPDDRDQEISAKWEIRVKVIDSNYQSRETPYIMEDSNEKYLVMGKYSRSVHLFYEDSSVKYSNKPVIKLSNLGKFRAYSESYLMRFNQIGFD